MPKGVANPNKTMKSMALFRSWDSLKRFDKEMPKDIEAGPLWQQRPMIKLTTPARSDVSPNAIPSKIEWVDRAMSKTKDLRIEKSQHFDFTS